MIDQIEAFMNKLTDIDWGWWPVVFLRPAKDKDIDNVILLKLSLVFGSAIALFWLLLVFLRKEFITSGTFVSAFILGWLFFFVGSKISYVYFWNRRARRLRKERRAQSVAQTSS